MRALLPRILLEVLTVCQRADEVAWNEGICERISATQKWLALYFGTLHCAGVWKFGHFEFVGQLA